MKKEKLNVLWTTDNKEVFLHMAAMYCFNAMEKGWFEEVNILIWGPSARLASEDDQVQKEMKKMMNVGVTIEACKACAEIYKADKKLADIGVDVKYTGTTLSDYLKSEERFLSI